MRFHLIDRITALAPGESITAIKNLTTAEEYLADHFPGFAVMPGVMMVETLVQASAWLIRATDDFRDSVILLHQAKAVKFNNFVRPGQTLTVTCTIHSRGEGETTLKVSGAVDGQNNVSARITLAHFNLADRNPALAASDQQRIVEYRQQYQQIWTPPVAV